MKTSRQHTTMATLKRGLTTMLSNDTARNDKAVKLTFCTMDLLVNSVKLKL
jgi:hypothetical protein